MAKIELRRRPGDVIVEEALTYLAPIMTDLIVFLGIFITNTKPTCQ
jgi:hypothetical protein